MEILRRITGHFRSIIKQFDKPNLHLVVSYGPSMLPTIDKRRSLFIAERIFDQYGKLVRRDVVVLRSPENPNKRIIKRLVGMEGDVIRYVSVIKNKKTAAFISSRPKDSYKHGTVVVPRGHVWVQGDNIYQSRDSRDFGPVPYCLVESKLYWRVLPLRCYGPFEGK